MQGRRQAILKLLLRVGDQLARADQGRDRHPQGEAREHLVDQLTHVGVDLSSDGVHIFSPILGAVPDPLSGTDAYRPWTVAQEENREEKSQTSNFSRA